MVQEPNLRILVRAPRLRSVVKPVLGKPGAEVTAGVSVHFCIVRAWGIEGYRFLPGEVLGAGSVGGGNPCLTMAGKIITLSNLRQSVVATVPGVVAAWRDAEV